MLAYLMAIICALLAILCLGIVLLRRDNKNRCTAHVVGTVTGGSKVHYGYNLLPRCAYRVNGTDYEITGPKFEYGMTGPSVQSNLTTRENLPRTFKGPQITFSGNIRSLHYRDLHYHKSALSELYPVGSEVDIWYDPADPRNAYVQRPIREGRILRILMSVFGSVFLLAALLFLLLGASGAL